MYATVHVFCNVVERKTKALMKWCGDEPRSESDIIVDRRGGKTKQHFEHETQYDCETTWNILRQ